MAAIHTRIESANRSAKQWEADRDLLAEIRQSIPLKELVPELVCDNEKRWNVFLDGVVVDSNRSGPVQCTTDCYKEDDGDWEGDDLLLKRLTLYFKQSVMKWCNQPPCSNPNCKGNEDGKQMEAKGVRGPISDDEKAGKASRVEVYSCRLCGAETTFPRYNSPRMLNKSRRGRCGEFANLFGTYCRALGFDTRYILDLTDHVWVEVWSVRQQRWIHADSCEGIVDRPSMYEQGWGKKLSYVIGATHDSVADVTRRYTRKLNSDDFLARRREFTPDETTGDRAFVQMDLTIRQVDNLPKGRLEELDKRVANEKKYFGIVQSSGVWDKDYYEGRLSGSLAWRAARKELGNDSGEAMDDDENAEISSFLVESFYTSSGKGDNLSIEVKVPAAVSEFGGPCDVLPSSCIVVDGVPCAAALNKGGTCVAVIDERSGCILQSRGFGQWTSFCSFIDTLTDGRVLAICHVKPAGGVDDQRAPPTKETSESLLRLGGFKIEDAVNAQYMIVGQLNHRPAWTTMSTAKGIKVTIKLNQSARPATKLRSEMNVVPSTLSSRLPESIMPIKEQLLASEYQKRVAFNAYMSRDGSNPSVVGYCTGGNKPVYLIDNGAVPFKKAEKDSCWSVYHHLPTYLVDDDDDVTQDDGKEKSDAAKFDIPIADDHFTQLLGNQLLSMSSSGGTSETDTSAAIANTRLVALYFSAHWCGPCRGFTPMLIEFYNVLKEAHPAHGIEIIFVSSDRDEPSFLQYFSTMPFLALPFSNRALAQQVKSMFGVRGIPSLVVLDSMSCQIVVPPDRSRQMVHQSCQRGEDAIEHLFKTWIDLVPAESKAMLEILAMSCQEAEQGSDGVGIKLRTNAHKYFARKAEESKSLSKEEFSARVKTIFGELVATGLGPNEAAAEAINRATNEQSKTSTPSDEGALSGTGEVCDATVPEFTSIASALDEMCKLNNDDRSSVASVLKTARKYILNVKKDPHNPRYRSFRLSNKVFDQITSKPGSIALITWLGFSIYSSDTDFYACIPLTIDLDAFASVLDKAIQDYS
ncbi:hypothetical protein THAOC_02700 [Thalassiosira oceanica]|uniref:Thioredoxin domain-containing protein n=1 Tax=Thalassiosira oceanica TaxID=159749 RepID=K0TEM7_THAOC|nr:hypothetical protein THAOC_02700 [Thalassiosira oceanica]|eukprot:EJK75569.1 hypothetical protein THAOC_02700 [Thalassiosira oceanica]